MFLSAGTSLIHYDTVHSFKYKYRMFYRYDDDYIASEMKDDVRATILCTLKRDTDFVAVYNIPNLGNVKTPTCVIMNNINTYIYILPYEYVTCMGNMNNMYLTGKSLRANRLYNTSESSMLGTCLLFSIGIISTILLADLMLR